MIITEKIKNTIGTIKNSIKSLNLTPCVMNIYNSCDCNNWNFNELLTTKNKDSNYLLIPSCLEGFTNTSTDRQIIDENKIKYCFNGKLEIKEDDYICKECGCRMHINNSSWTELKHLCFGNNLTSVHFKCTQFYCPNCHHSNMQNIPFKNNKHRITNESYNCARDLLATGHYTNVEVAELTGLNRNIVKDIDKERLLEKYTIDGKELIKPELQAKYLAIDEFKLHNGYKYATHIMDLETGHVLWIQEGKKKQVVYDFINHVGNDFMENVMAVACDMNSDFEEAFRDKYPHIKIVFDYFHIVKNYNDKVINAIRKDEQVRLIAEGKETEARSLKRSKYILTSSKETLIKKDKDAEDNKAIRKGSELFHTTSIPQKGGKMKHYEKIINENKLLFTAELIKEKISHAYTLTDEEKMKNEINEIIEMCEETKNKHLIWFAKLLKNHLYGIITHATIPISTGKMEGMNNKIKTLRRQAYGYQDDEYFFLKIMDISRTK